MRKRSLLGTAVATLIVAAAIPSAHGQEIKIGFTGTFTGPGASQGAPSRQTIEIFPKTLGGIPVRWIVLDDATDPSTAVKNVRRFVDDEKVDAIVGSTTTLTATAMADAIAQGQTLQISLSPVVIPADKLAWIFNLPQPVPIMVSALVDDLKKRNIKRAAFIGYTDGWGDLTSSTFGKLTKDAGIEVVGSERFNRADTSVTAQALKLLSASPQAVFVGAGGTAAALAHVALVDQGFTGPIYHTHGAIMQAFINAGGKSLEGALLPTGPMVVANELPKENPIKAVSEDFIRKFQARFGNEQVSPIAGYAWDAVLLLDAAAAKAIKVAKPGTPEFRVALRDAMQGGSEVVGTNAIYKYTPSDHYGVDARARVLVTVKQGTFRLYP